MDTFVRPSVGSGAMTLPARWYISPEVFKTERERVFGASWIGIGRSDSLAKPGDYFLAEVAGESLILTRDPGGKLHAFFNVCRHRGTRMCETASGHFQGSIQCPYHAWTYGLDGTLKAARNMAEVPGFDRADYPLKEAAVAEWEGFILVNLAPEPEPFETAFAPLFGRFAKWDIGSLVSARTIHYDLACNWKLVFQNYSECYHCPLVHPQLDKLSPSDSGRNDLSEGAFLGGYSELREHATSLTTSGHTARPALGTVAGEEVNRIYYYTIFPSMLLSLHADYIMVHYVRPLSEGRTLVDCAWLFDPKAAQEAHFDPSDAVEFWDLTNRQDWHVSELTFAGLHSRAYSPGPFSNAEGLLGAFDRHYLDVME
jgi:glycine betaine catabolism A